MIDIKPIRANPEMVKENIRNKFQVEKLVLVDEMITLDMQYRNAKSRCDILKSQKKYHS